MKFLIDNQLPRALRNFLLDKGHDAVHVLDLGMATASDPDAINLFLRELRSPSAPPR